MPLHGLSPCIRVTAQITLCLWTQHLTDKGAAATSCVVPLMENFLLAWTNVGKPFLPFFVSTEFNKADLDKT